MKKALAALAGIGLTLTLTACGDAADHEINLQERDNVIGACTQASRAEVFEIGGYGGGWLQYGDWDFTPTAQSRGTITYQVAGRFDSDRTGAIPVSCEVNLTLADSSAKVFSHQVSAPEIDFVEIATDACHTEVLKESRYPSETNFVETMVIGEVSTLDDGARSVGIAGDVDIPNAFGTPERQGFACFGVIVEPDGIVRYSSALVADYLRGAYTEQANEE